ncbi:hypothetical protein [Nocardioides sediminis]|uniref:hypothetical protein n=1 Tax=Nocardioides sediminis TaxID=433648 RepID=UPI00131EF9DF|nr:hypothetical protein [Nocardioides sediminis]
MLSDVGGVSGVRSTLSSVKVPPDVIEQIVKFLETTSGEFDPDGFTPVAGTWFGGSGSAATLGLHTGKAHAKINNALLEAVMGIQDTTSAIETFDREISRADADSEAAAQALLHRTQLAVDQMDGDRNTPPTRTSTPGSDR